jgi:hypothetical protein
MSFAFDPDSCTYPTDVTEITWVPVWATSPRKRAFARSVSTELPDSKYTICNAERRAGAAGAPPVDWPVDALGVVAGDGLVDGGLTGNHCAYRVLSPDSCVCAPGVNPMPEPFAAVFQPMKSWSDRVHTVELGVAIHDVSGPEPVVTVQEPPFES